MPLCPSTYARSGLRVTTEGLTICRNPHRWYRRDGGTCRAPLRRKSNANCTFLSRSQPGRLRSYAYPVRPLHSDAGGSFGYTSGRGLTAKRGGAGGRPFYSSEQLNAQTGKRIVAATPARSCMNTQSKAPGASDLCGPCRTVEEEPSRLDSSQIDGIYVQSL